MKKYVAICLILLGLGCYSLANAQEQDRTVKQDAKKAGKDLKEGAKEMGHDAAKGAKKAGNKTAEIASKGKSKIADEVYKDKVGPDGQTIYIDSRSRYYWIDKRGRKQYVSSDALKDKEG